MSMPDSPLPDFRNPPVVEIIAAVQFAPIQVFGVSEVVAVGHALEGWEPVEAPPALPPIAETAAGAPESQAWMGFGDPPRRFILSRDDGRWIAQVQQDRVAIHETKAPQRPSFSNVAPMLKRFSDRVGPILGVDIFAAEGPADIVEVIYDNHIAAEQGGWSRLQDLHRVLRVLGAEAGEPPFDAVEATSVSFSYVLEDSGVMEGRLRVIGTPQTDPSGRPALNLRVISRRFVRNTSLHAVLERCHADIVRAFTATTTPTMHEIWGRYR